MRECRSKKTKTQSVFENRLKEAKIEQKGWRERKKKCKSFLEKKAPHTHTHHPHTHTRGEKRLNLK